MPFWLQGLPPCGTPNEVPGTSRLLLKCFLSGLVICTWPTCWLRWAGGLREPCVSPQCSTFLLSWMLFHSPSLVPVVLLSWSPRFSDLGLLVLPLQVNALIKDREGYAPGTEFHRCKEMSEYCSTLCRHLYLFPGHPPTWCHLPIIHAKWKPLDHRRCDRAFDLQDARFLFCPLRDVGISQTCFLCPWSLPLSVGLQASSFSVKPFACRASFGWTYCQECFSYSWRASQVKL